MEGLEIGCLVVDISGIKSGFKTHEDAEQNVGVVVDYVFDVPTCQILVEVDWSNSVKSLHAPESLEPVVNEALIH